MKVFAKRVVLGNGIDEPFRVVSAELGIKGDLIETVEERDTPSETSVEHLGERVVCPAFVNAHTHVALSAFRGLASSETLRGNMVESLFYRLEENLSDEDMRAFARVGAYECLLSGTGLVWDHYYGGAALADAFVDAGLAAVLAPTVQDVSGPGAKKTEEQLQATHELDQSSWSARGVWGALGPHATDTVSPELWSRIGELAEENDWVVHAHLAQSIEEYRRSVERHGCSPMQLLERTGVLSRARALLVHALFVSDADLALL
ncbi:MAG: amidohydrolase family protein, partial [Myxococcota bacterium]